LSWPGVAYFGTEWSGLIAMKQVAFIVRFGRPKLMMWSVGGVDIMLETARAVS